MPIIVRMGKPQTVRTSLADYRDAAKSACVYFAVMLWDSVKWKIARLDAVVVCTFMACGSSIYYRTYVLGSYILYR